MTVASGLSSPVLTVPYACCECTASDVPADPICMDSGCIDPDMVVWRGVAVREMRARWVGSRYSYAAFIAESGIACARWWLEGACNGDCRP